MSRRFQFSVRVLLVGTAAAAAVVGLVCAKAPWQVSLWLEFISFAFSLVFVMATCALHSKRAGIWVVTVGAGAITMTTYFFALCLALPNGDVDLLQWLATIADGFCVAFFPVVWCAAIANSLLAFLIYRAISRHSSGEWPE